MYEPNKRTTSYWRYRQCLYEPNERTTSYWISEFIRTETCYWSAQLLELTLLYQNPPKYNITILWLKSSWLDFSDWAILWIISNQTHPSPHLYSFVHARPCPWHKWMQSNHHLAWDAFTHALEMRFGPSTYKNHLATLFKLCARQPQSWSIEPNLKTFLTMCLVFHQRPFSTISFPV